MILCITVFVFTYERYWMGQESNKVLSELRTTHQVIRNRCYASCTSHTLWLTTMMINLVEPTAYLLHQQVFNIQKLYILPTLLMCIIFILDQILTFALCNINWLVFVTEMKSIYCAVWTGYSNKTVYTLFLKS